MSRIGKRIITIPNGVKVNKKNRTVVTEGPKGKLEMDLRPEIDLDIEDNAISVKIVSTNNRNASAFYGMTRALVQNMVTGVHAGYQKQLDVKGVGYRAEVKGDTVVLNLGFTHDVVEKIPQDVKVEVDKNNRITISGCDKQKVGQLAAVLRSYKPADPYKLKGVTYSDEVVKKKVGKAGAK